MRLERLDLTAFGHFSGRTLDFGAAPADDQVNSDGQASTPAPHADFHIIYGDNEAGKSTTLSAIVELLFGMPTRSSWNFLHANDVLELGARLRQPVQGAAQLLDVRRFKNRLLDADGNRLNDIIIDTHGLTREAFIARFSLDDQVLEQGSEAILKQEGDLGAALFGASSGLSDISARLEEAMENANAFWQPNKRVGIALPELCKELDALKASRQERDLEARDWKLMRKSIETKRETCQSLEASLKALEATCKRHERDRTAIGRATSLEERKSQLEALQAPPKWPGQRPRSASREIQQLAVADARIATTESLRQNEHEKANRLNIDTRVLDARERIESVSRQYDSLATEHTDRPALEEHRRSMELRLQSLNEQLTALPTNKDAANLLTADILDRFDQLAREFATLTADHQAAQVEIRRSQDALADHTRSSETLSTSDGERPDQEWATALAPESDALSQPVIAQDDVRLLRLKTQLDSVNDSAPLARLEESRDRLIALEHERDEAVSQLIPWQGTPEKLMTMSLPSAASLDSLEKRLAELAEQRRQTLSRQNETERALSALTEQQRSLKGGGGVATIDLEASRALRDQCFDALESGIESRKSRTELASLLNTLRASSAGLDALVRQQIANSEISANIQQTVSQASLERTRLEQLESTLLAMGQANAAANQELDAGNTDIQLPSPTPASLREWLRKREAALTCNKHVKQAQSTLEKRQAEVSACTASLVEALLPCMEHTAPEPVHANMPLTDLLGIARDTLKQLQERQDASMRELAEHHRLSLDVHQRQRRLNGTRHHLDDWHEQWLRAISSAGLEADWIDVPTESIIDQLPLLRKRGECHKELKRSENALESFDEHVTQFEQAVLTLAQHLLPDTHPHADDFDASTTLSSIKRILDEALKAQAELARSKARQAALDEEIAELQREFAPLRRQVNEMMNLTGSQNANDLQESLEAMARYDDLQSSIHELEQDLQTTLAPEALPIALKRLNALDAEALEVDIDHIGDQISQLREQLAQSQQELMRLELNTEGMADDDTIAELVETRENLLLDIEERARDTLSLRLGKLAVEAALRRYRDAHRSSMLHHARKAFTELTRGHYKDLRAQADNKGMERLIGIRRNGVSLQAGQMSKGTRFQLFLALRIAAYHEYADQRTPLPFIADDILESSDDHRTQAAITQLHAMAQRGQVIYLTHHQHLVDIAREQCGSELTVHQLAQ